MSGHRQPRLTDPQIRVLKLVAAGSKDQPGLLAAHHMNGIDQHIAARLGEMGLLVLKPLEGAPPAWRDWHLTDVSRAVLKGLAEADASAKS